MSFRGHGGGNRSGNSNNNYNANNNRSNYGGNPHTPNRQYNPNQGLKKRTGTMITISNHPQHWAFRDFQNKLNSLYSAKWLSNQFKPGLNSVTIEVDSSQATNFVKNVNGQRIDGCQIRAVIDRSNNNNSNNNMNTNTNNPSGPMKATNLSNNIVNALQQRYDPNSCYLSLQALAQSVQGFDFNNKTHTDTLSDCISAYPDTHSLSLSDNHLNHLKFMKRLCQSVPELKNLSLANNNLNNILELDTLSYVKDHLQQLHLANNPVVSNADVSLLQHSLTSRFPFLTSLDSKPITPIIQFNLPKQLSSSTMPPARGSCVAPEIQGIAEEFVSNFFRLYDSARRDVGVYYTSASHMSISVCSDVTNDSRMEPYFSVSRNLHKSPITSTSALNTIYQGQDAIAQVYNKLPNTFHDIESFTCDSFAVQLGSQTVINLSIHGQVLDTNAQVIRDFYRTFVLAAPPQGSEAQVRGLAVVILNDSMYVPTKSSAYDMSQGVPSHSTTITTNTMNINQQPQQPQQPQQQPLVVNGKQFTPEESASIYAVMQQAQVSADIAVQALQQTQGNVQNAVMGIRQARGH